MKVDATNNQMHRAPRPAKALNGDRGRGVDDLDRWTQI